MLDYINIDEAKQAELEAKHPADLAAAGLYITHGFRQGIVDGDEAIPALHNILVAILMQPD